MTYTQLRINIDVQYKSVYSSSVSSNAIFNSIIFFCFFLPTCCCVLQTSFCTDFQLWSNFEYVRHNKPSTMSVNWYRSLRRWVTFIHNATSPIWKMTIQYGNGVELLMETYCHNCLRVFLM